MSPAEVPASAEPNLLAAVLKRCANEEGGISQLAKSAGVSRDTLHALLANRRLPGRHVASALARYLSARPPSDDAVDSDTVRDWARSPDELSDL